VVRAKATPVVVAAILKRAARCCDRMKR